MKKQISFVLIGLMIVSGLILALPFSPLRRSLQVLDCRNNMLVEVNPRINSDRNVAVAHAIAINLFQIDGHNEMGVNNSVLNSGQLSTNKNSNVVSSLQESANRTQTQQAIDGSYIADRNFSLSSQSQSAGRPAANSADINRTSYKTNMTSRTAANNSKSRLMAMSGSFNSEKAATEGSVRQMAGGAPPPSEDEVIGSLPVGDGSGFLLFLMVMFGMFKARKLIIL